MYDAPPSRRPLPYVGPVGELRGPWMADVQPGDLGGSPKQPRSAALGALAQQCERSRAEAMARGSLVTTRPNSSRSIASAASSALAPPQPCRLDRRRNCALAPWEGPAVQEFTSRLRDTRYLEAGNAPSAMVLQKQGCTMLAAIGDQEDHKVAGKALADLQAKRGSAAKGPDERSGSGTRSSLVCVGPGQPAPLERAQVAFGAVYEHRDMAGKPRFVASTNILPERQFQLDWQEQSTIKELSSQQGPASGHLVWVGIGAGPVGEQEMQRVRHAVVDARAERLQLKKLASEKPYSQHF